MRVYTIVMLLGLGMVIYAYFQFTANHHGAGEVSLLDRWVMILGGLGLMGGLFGFSIAVFFHLWHGKAK
ncbi:MAG: hypothetical protein R8K53_10300 [Mariprofundaceae bacterium]